MTGLCLNLRLNLQDAILHGKLPLGSVNTGSIRTSHRGLTSMHEAKTEPPNQGDTLYMCSQLRKYLGSLSPVSVYRVHNSPPGSSLHRD
jgi:hypothetical protein